MAPHNICKQHTQTGREEEKKCNIEDEEGFLSTIFPFHVNIQDNTTRMNYIHTLQIKDILHID